MPASTGPHAIAAIAARQHGLFTATQARQAAMRTAQLRHRVDSGFYESLGAGVYRIAGTPPTWRHRLLATCLAGGPDCVVSHRSAAVLHGFDGFRVGRPTWDPRRGLVPIPAVEVTVARPHNRFGDELVHLSRDLRSSDRTAVDAIPCTTVARTIVDLASVVHPNRLEETIDAAERDGLTTGATVRATLEALRRRGRPGVRALDDVLRRRGDGPVPESRLERRLLRLITRWGLPHPVRQVEITRPDGRTARADFAYPDRRVVVEVDGHGAHATRRQRQADAERHNDLRARSWSVVRFTYEDVTERPEHVVRTLRQVLAADAPPTLRTGARS